MVPKGSNVGSERVKFWFRKGQTKNRFSGVPDGSNFGSRWCEPRAVPDRSNLGFPMGQISRSL